MADISSDFREIVNHDVIPLFPKGDMSLEHVVKRNALCRSESKAVLGITVRKHAHAGDAFLLALERKEHGAMTIGARCVKNLSFASTSEHVNSRFGV